MLDRVPFVDKELFLLHELAPRDGTALDIGAAGGIHTLVLGAAVGASGTVHAFEPRPGSARLVRGLARLAGMLHVDVHTLALGARHGVANLSVPLVGTLASTGTGAAGFRTLTVPETTMDLHVAAAGIDRVDVVKIDAEGAEPAILAGAVATIERFRPAVVCEVWPSRLAQHGRDVAHVEAFFRDRGYRVHRFDGARLQPVRRIDGQDDDYVFLPQ